MRLSVDSNVVGFVDQGQWRHDHWCCCCRRFWRHMLLGGRKGPTIFITCERRRWFLALLLLDRSCILRHDWCVFWANWWWDEYFSSGKLIPSGSCTRCLPDTVESWASAYEKACKNLSLAAEWKRRNMCIINSDKLYCDHYQFLRRRSDNWRNFGDPSPDRVSISHSLYGFPCTTAIRVSYKVENSSKIGKLVSITLQL